jgi:hypothetical protein
MCVRIVYKVRELPINSAAQYPSTIIGSNERNYYTKSSSTMCMTPCHGQFACGHWSVERYEIILCRSAYIRNLQCPVEDCESQSEDIFGSECAQCQGQAEVSAEFYETRPWHFWSIGRSHRSLASQRTHERMMLYGENRITAQDSLNV